MKTTMNDGFEAACAAAKQRMETRETIGRLQEKTLHATLKFFLDADERHHEVRLTACEGKPIADIFDGERVTEIQNGNFSGFRPKLERLLAVYPVTVVYPVVRKKQVVWIDPETGEITTPRLSPKTGSPADALPELIFIEKQLFHPNLTLRLLPVDVTEYRLQDGWGAAGKRGAHRVERLPEAIFEPIDVRTPRDLLFLLPKLPAEFTAADFSHILRLRGRKLSAALKVLTLSGCVEQTGKEGRKNLYRIPPLFANKA